MFWGTHDQIGARRTHLGAEPVSRSTLRREDRGRQPSVRVRRCPEDSPGRATNKNRQKLNTCIYTVVTTEISLPPWEDPMPFKPNYGRDRAERQRAARSRTEEKQRKKEEKATLRKAQREAAVAPNPDEPAVRSEASPDAKLRGMLDEREP